RSQNWLARKIWGKDNPLPADPYTTLSQIAPGGQGQGQGQDTVISSIDEDRGGKDARGMAENGGGDGGRAMSVTRRRRGEGGFYVDEHGREFTLEEWQEGLLRPAQGEGEGEGEREYVPAKTWRGLRSLRPSEWDAQAGYKGFVSEKKVQEKQHVELAVQRACVEIYALKQHGSDIDCVYKATSALDAEGRTRVCTKTSFERLPNAEVVLRFADEGAKMDIVGSIMAERGEGEEVVEQEGLGDKQEDGAAGQITEVEESAQREDEGMVAKDMQESMQQHQSPSTIEDAEQVSAATVQEDAQTEGSITGPVDQSWRTIPLTNPELKFAIMKRTCQLLGLRIPDPQIASINDTTSLLNALLQKPKPNKLVEEMVSGGRLEGLKNVQVFRKRYTVIDREEEVGRLKLIETELVKRGLPIKRSLLVKRK
ncbi:MAG: hypothetical protein Q9217_006492, partial [Psora testacea]